MSVLLSKGNHVKSACGVLLGVSNLHQWHRRRPATAIFGVTTTTWLLSKQDGNLSLDVKKTYFQKKNGWEQKDNEAVSGKLSCSRRHGKTKKSKLKSLNKIIQRKTKSQVSYPLKGLTIFSRTMKGGWVQGTSTSGDLSWPWEGCFSSIRVKSLVNKKIWVWYGLIIFHQPNSWIGRSFGWASLIGDSNSEFSSFKV